jgi:hypothetical protein
MPGIRDGWRTIPTRYIVRKKQAFKVEAIPVDHDLFRQCHECGLIVPVYELEKEASIKDVVETVENPFDIAKNEFLGVDSRSARKRKRLKDKQQDFDYINNDDLKRELRKGSTLLSYSEQIPQ